MQHRVRETLCAVMAPWLAATAAGLAVLSISRDAQGWVGAVLFFALISLYAAWTPWGLRAPALAYFAGIVLTPLLILAMIALTMATGLDSLGYFVAAANVGYNPVLGPDFDGVSLVLIWCAVFGLVSSAAIGLRQVILLFREDRISRRDERG
jgi:hypothetical protein